MDGPQSVVWDEAENRIHAQKSILAWCFFFVVWITTMEAVLSVPLSYRETALAFGASRWAMFVHVTWPSILPQIFVGMRLAIGMAVLIIVGVEFVQGDVGVGFRIWNSWSLFQADRMYVGICTVAVLGYVLTVLVRAGSHLALPWVRNARGGRV